MQEDDYNPKHGRPSYEWLAANGFSGLSYTLREHHDLTVKEFFVDEVGLDDENPGGNNEESGYDWGVRSDETIEAIQTYLSTQRNRGELAPSTVVSRRSRLAEYARIYEQLHGPHNLTRNLDHIDERPAENDRCMEVFDILKDRLSTDQSRLKLPRRCPAVLRSPSTVRGREIQSTRRSQRSIPLGDRYTRQQDRRRRRDAGDLRGRRLY